MASVTLSGIRKLYNQFEVIKGVDLTIADRELVVFVGPSGCGKSTLLRMIAGLEDIDYGTIAIGDRDVTELAPARRGVAMVFQNYALYPHMSAYDNMAYGLRRAGLKPDDVDRRVRKTAALLQIEELLPRRPKAMSGGQRQRVAIGRAIVRNPDVFLFDEPLSNLDAALRVEMRSQIARLHLELQATMIFVTHDQVEAMTLADRIVVLNAGVIEQVGTPREVYHRPRNLFVAGFIGSPAMNLLPGKVTAQSDSLSVALDGGATLTVPGWFGALPAGSPVTVGIRPERLALAAGDAAQLRGDLTLAEHLGDETILHLRRPDGGALVLKAPDDIDLAHGSAVGVAIDVSGACVFGPEGNNLAVGDA